MDLEIGRDRVENDLIRAIASSTPVVRFHRQEKYFPCSFEYYAKRCSIRFRRNGKTLFPEGSEDKIATQIVKEFSEESKADEDDFVPPIIWKPSCQNMNELLMDVGALRGYSDITHTDHKLRGDIPYYITAYSNGIVECRHSNVKFCDVVFTIHFMWNGTMGYHACDIEEIIVRYQYGLGNVHLGYDRIRDNEILKDQGVLDRTSWFVARVFLSAHGNAMAFPTKTPGRKHTKVEFDNSRIVVYSARGSHAMYATPGTKRRIFGFANDITDNAGLEWRPKRVVLWMPMFLTSGRLCDPLLIDVDGKQKTMRATPKTHPFYYLSFFRGKIGNIENSQTTAPFKSGLTNIMTDGDFYYKFQGGGLENAIAEVLSIPVQVALLLVTGIISLLSLGTMIALSIASPHEDWLFTEDWLFVLLGFIGSVCFAFFVLLFFVGNRNAS